MAIILPIPITCSGVKAANDRRSPDLTLLVPAYNEESRLPATLLAIQDYLDDWGGDYEVIVVDDGSSDTTAQVTDRFSDHFHTVRLPSNQGKGAAVRAGMLAAKGQIVAFTDADLPYELSCLRTSYELIAAGEADVALGARDIDGSGCRVRRRLIRTAASSVFRWLTRQLISKRITDTQAGFKCFSRTAAHELFSRTVIDSFAFDTELIFLIRRLGLNWQLVPVTLINERSSTLSLFRHTLPMLLDMCRVRWNDWMGLYDEPLPTTLAFPQAAAISGTIADQPSRKVA